MRKIKIIFDRNWETDRKVNAKLVVDFDFAEATATEKLDGTISNDKERVDQD